MKMLPLSQILLFVFSAVLAYLITDWMPRQLMGKLYRGPGGYLANTILAIVCFVLFNGYGDLNYALVGLGGSAAATFGRAVQQIRERRLTREAARQAVRPVLSKVRSQRRRRQRVTIEHEGLYEFIPRYPFDSISKT